MKRMTAVMFVALLAAGTVSAAGAQSPGAEIYKTKCQMCHGATGMGDSPAGKAMKVKPITDPSVKKISEEQMIADTRDGVGKMKPFKGTLSDAQIKDAVKHFRSFLK